MTNDSLAARRAALIVECSQQRTTVAREFSTLRAPSILTGGGGISISKLKVPLTIAGVVLGMIATKPSRALPLLATGLSLLKVVTSVLSMLRKPTD